MLFGFLVLVLGLGYNQVFGATAGSTNPQNAVTTVFTLDSESSVPIPLNPGIYGTRLCAIRVETKQLNQSYSRSSQGKNDHVIEFYEFRNGISMVHESKSADDGQPLLIDSLHGENTLVEKFRALCPGKVVPQTLFGADIRAAYARIQAPAPTSAATPLTIAALPAATAQVSAAYSCSPDFFKDGWGGYWFVHYRCPPSGQYTTYGVNRTNMTWYTPDDMDYYHMAWLNGDFYNTMRTRGYERECDWLVDCYWDPVWDYYLLPRQIDGQNWSSMCWNDPILGRQCSSFSLCFTLNSGCGHADYTVGYGNY